MIKVRENKGQGLPAPVKVAPAVPKFRETLWFKKGELDAEQAQLAADGDDDLRPDAVDSLPVEDRYCGPVHSSDTSHFGVHSGTTQAVGMERKAADEGEVSESELVAELKQRRPVVALGLVGVGLCAFAVLIAQIL
ncbi:MAG TPA: hypothetical protein VMZ28_04150 [Kofleriaceae bacterium]|nr:hypothetical protein [Kofleriaceae bacterium]